MNKYAWLVLATLTFNSVAVLAQEKTDSTPAPIATEKPAEAAAANPSAAPTAASNTESAIDPDLKQARDQAGTLKYSHDAFSKGIMTVGSSSSFKSLLPSLSGADDLGLQNYGTYTLMLLYEGNKDKAISTMNELDAKVSKSGEKNTVLAGNQFYFAIACYLNDDLENAEKFGMKTVERYVASGTKDGMDLMNLQQCYFLLALIKDKQGKTQEAIELAKKGTALKPY